MNDNPIADSLYQASVGITSAGVVPAGGNVIFRGQNFIELKEGFEVENTGLIEILIEPCQ